MTDDLRRPTWPDEPRWALPAARAAMAIAAAAMLARTIYLVAIGSDGYLNLQQDDFYYYAVTARNLALHGISSFDGFTRTNGYQPLWMAIVSALAWICNGTTPAFFLVISAISFAATLATFELYLRVGRALFRGAWFVVPSALLIGVQFLRMIFWGMETVVILPLYALLLLQLLRAAEGGGIDRKRALRLGLLSALVILARLDTAIFVGLVVCGWLLWERMALGARLNRLLWFCLGGMPLLLYLIWNLASFGALTPVSAQAKHLKIGWGFSTYFLSGLTWTWDGRATLAMLPLALLLPFLAGSGIPRGARRFLVIATVLFPIIFYVMLGFVSDWQLFGWYLYPVPIVMFLVLCQMGALVSRHLPDASRMLRHVALPIAAMVPLAIALPLALRQSLGRSVDPNSIYLHARALIPFARAHPGRYAMGDRAGLTALMIDRPILHLEGLIADPAMVEHIRREDRLSDVLAAYDIDYVIVSIYYPIQHHGNRYEVIMPDPIGAGRRSHVMRGIFTGPPIFTYVSERGNQPGSPNQIPGDRSGRCYTYVFEKGEWGE